MNLEIFTLLLFFSNLATWKPPKNQFFFDLFKISGFAFWRFKKKGILLAFWCLLPVKNTELLLLSWRLLCSVLTTLLLVSVCSFVRLLLGIVLSFTIVDRSHRGFEIIGAVFVVFGVWCGVGGGDKGERKKTSNNSLCCCCCCCCLLFFSPFLSFFWVLSMGKMSRSYYRTRAGTLGLFLFALVSLLLLVFLLLSLIAVPSSTDSDFPKGAKVELKLPSQQLLHM
jgi:hypothetical protein